MELISAQLLQDVTEKAKSSPRLRMNYNFHRSLDEKCHRMLNAMEPGTIIPIHRHDIDETIVVLSGSLKQYIYTDNGLLKEEALLKAGHTNMGVNIPAGEWHSVEILDSGTVIFECKAGPYIPPQPEDILNKQNEPI